MRITVQPSGRSFTAEDGETILEAGLREGINLPYGCRNGACGSCKGRVLSGSVNYGEYQASALSDKEREAGMALFCSARPLTDLVIEAREVNAARDVPVKTMPCRVERMERVSDDVMVLHLKLPASERLLFLPGQYVEILLKDGRRRAFSIANPPHDDGLLQLHLRHVPGGIFTEHVFHGMKEREILRLQGPLGSFYLREESDRPIVFLASGTGFAPIKSILEHVFHVGALRPMVLYWGGRRRKDLYMSDLPEQWAREHPELRYVPVLSDAQPEDGWTGRTGLVHQAVLDDIPDLGGYEVYACGSPGMVEAAARCFLGEHRLAADAFFSDAFIPSRDAAPAGG